VCTISSQIPRSLATTNLPHRTLPRPDQGLDGSLKQWPFRVIWYIAVPNLMLLLRVVHRYLLGYEGWKAKVTMARAGRSCAASSCGLRNGSNVVKGVYPKQVAQQAWSTQFLVRPQREILPLKILNEFAACLDHALFRFAVSAVKRRPGTEAKRWTCTTNARVWLYNSKGEAVCRGGKTQPQPGRPNVGEKPKHHKPKKNEHREGIKGFLPPSSKMDHTCQKGMALPSQPCLTA